MSRLPTWSTLLKEATDDSEGMAAQLKVAILARASNKCISLGLNIIMTSLTQKLNNPVPIFEI